MVIRDLIFFSVLLFGNILLIDFGVRKYLEKRFLMHRRYEISLTTTYFMLILLIPAIKFDLWNYDRYLIIFIAIVYGVMIFYRFINEAVSIRVTIYNIEELELCEIINLALTDLGIEFEHKTVKEGKSIYKINNSKAKIIVKEVPIFANNKEVSIIHVNEFSFKNEFLSILKSEIIKRNQNVRRFRGIGDVLLGIGLITIFLFIFLAK